MMYCEKHSKSMPIDGCPLCVREERDRLREENEFLANAMREEIVGLSIMREERDRLRKEVTRLRDLIPQAWSAGQARVIGSHKDFQQTHPTLQEWMKQKGLL